MENEQKGKVSSEGSSPLLHDPAVLDFSELKPSRFGISVKSFIPTATPKGEGQPDVLAPPGATLELRLK